MQLGMVAGWAAEVEAGAEGRRGAEYGGAASRGYVKVAAVCGLTGRRWSTAAAAAGRGRRPQSADWRRDGERPAVAS